jgi:hypothetical protein
MSLSKMKILLIFRFIPLPLAHKRLLYLNDNAIHLTISHTVLLNMSKRLTLELHKTIRLMMISRQC